jgi:hypothetical protein
VETGNVGSRVISVVLAIAVVVVGAVGLIDAGIGRVWDHVVVFAALLVLGVLLIARELGTRRRMTLRADLAGRLSQRALASGESSEAILDRAVATYLEALADGPTDPPGRSGTGSSG